MRVVVAPAGSRGDFQPLLALALGLRRAGHDVLMVTTPNFVAETQAFGLPVRAAGIDIEAYLRTLHFENSPMRATFELLKVARREAGNMVSEGLLLCKGADILVGAGAQIAGPTIAEALGIPYAYVAYTPQAFASDHHPPLTIPVQGLPRWANRFLWRLTLWITGKTLGRKINAARRGVGLALVRDWQEHIFPLRRSILAADAELAPPAPDTSLAIPPTGAWHLPDLRPLGEEVHRFLDAGPPPLYVGFGSMSDAHPARTTARILEAARSLGQRVILSRGGPGSDRTCAIRAVTQWSSGRCRMPCCSPKSQPSSTTAEPAPRPRPFGQVDRNWWFPTRSISSNGVGAWRLRGWGPSPFRGASSPPDASPSRSGCSCRRRVTFAPRRSWERASVSETRLPWAWRPWRGWRDEDRHLERQRHPLRS